MYIVHDRRVATREGWISKRDVGYVRKMGWVALSDTKYERLVAKPERWVAKYERCQGIY
jgi:hypothetical protein